MTSDLRRAQQTADPISRTFGVSAVIDPDLRERAGFEESIIVTHGGTLTYLISAWIRLPLDDAGYVKFSSAPGSITHLREDDATQDRCVVTVSHRGHLDGAY